MLREFMSRVVASEVTSDPALRAAIDENVLGNLAWWESNPERCCHLKWVQDGRLAGVVLVKEFWNLCSLFVEPALHRRGIGLALVEAAAEECHRKGAERVLRLNAAPNAVKFYEVLGFRFRETAQALPPGYRAMEMSL